MAIIVFPTLAKRSAIKRAEAVLGRETKEQRAQSKLPRRGSMDQGRALEALGHAVEYLIDSRIFLAGELDPKTDREAVQIMMRASKSVFAECPEVISLRQRLRDWVSDRLAGEPAAWRG